MPTKAQNEVHQKYGLRKGETWRAIRQAQGTLYSRPSRAGLQVLTMEDVAVMHTVTASLVYLSKVWRAYQECDRE